MKPRWPLEINGWKSDPEPSDHFVPSAAAAELGYPTLRQSLEESLGCCVTCGTDREKSLKNTFEHLQTSQNCVSTSTACQTPKVDSWWPPKSNWILCRPFACEVTRAKRISRKINNNYSNITHSMHNGTLCVPQFGTLGARYCPDPQAVHSRWHSREASHVDVTSRRLLSEHHGHSLRRISAVSFLGMYHDIP